MFAVAERYAGLSERLSLRRHQRPKVKSLSVAICDPFSQQEHEGILRHHVAFRRDLAREASIEVEGDVAFRHGLVGGDDLDVEANRDRSPRGYPRLNGVYHGVALAEGEVSRDALRPQVIRLLFLSALRPEYVETGAECDRDRKTPAFGDLPETTEFDIEISCSVCSGHARNVTPSAHPIATTTTIAPVAS